MLFQGSPKYYRIVDGISDFEQMPRLARFMNLSVVHRLPNRFSLLLPKVLLMYGYWSDEWRVWGKFGVKTRFTSSFRLIHH